MDRSWRPSRGDRMFQISPYTRARNRPFQPRWYYAGKRVSEHLLKSWHLGWATDPGGDRPGVFRQFADRRPDDDGGLREARPASWAGRECGGCPDDGGVEPFGFGAAQSDGEPDELVSGVSQISPRRPGIRQDREAGQPTDGRDAIPDHQRATHACVPSRPPQTCTQASSWQCDMVVKDPHERRE
jgi:hypothetical protein